MIFRFSKLIHLNRQFSYDYHWMAYEDRSCLWSDMIRNTKTPTPNQFKIQRHALQILQPVDDQGNLQCLRQDGRNSFPRLDYSKGFPNWWHLSHTKVTVPSEHFQHGKQYDAEVHLAHFYEVDHERRMGKVVIFLESDPNRDRWPFLDKLICQWREVEDLTRKECGLPSVPSYPGCRNPIRRAAPTPRSTGQPVVAPTSGPVMLSASPVVVPAVIGGGPVVCSNFTANPAINLNRICKDNGCCTNPRSASNDCGVAYKFFGDKMNEVCSTCCQIPKQVGPPSPAHPVYPSIDCTGVSNAFRICKAGSCCDPIKSRSSYCNDVYQTYGNTMGSVCWYCCSEPKEVDPSVLNNPLRRVQEIGDENMDLGARAHDNFHSDLRVENAIYNNGINLDPSNFEVNPNAVEQHLASLQEYERTSREGSRHLSGLQGDNYASVAYSPYQWLREVKTEYYFRYEGSQMVPPCFETVHYRVMKDAIRINPIQLAELERLLAWRIAPKDSGSKQCQNDTAGRPRAGSNGNAVDLNRPLQKYSNVHRKVFCECRDWRSKFQEDRDWCTLDQSKRWYTMPYNYESGGNY